LHRLEKGQDEFSKKLGDWLNRELSSFLTRDDDKALFGDLLGGSAAKGGKTPNLGTAQQHVS
jgi:hypothetical protein